MFLPSQLRTYLQIPSLLALCSVLRASKVFFCHVDGLLGSTRETPKGTIHGYSEKAND